MNPFNAAKAKFMEGPETPKEDASDSAMDLSPEGAQGYQEWLAKGQMPTPRDLAAAGLDPAEAMEVMELLDASMPDNEAAEGGAMDDGAPVPPKGIPLGKMR